MQIFKFQKHSCRLSFLFPPHCKAPQRACSQAILNTITGFAAKWHLRNVSADIPYWWHITAQNLGPVRIKFLQVTGPRNSDLRLVKMATKDIRWQGHGLLFKLHNNRIWNNFQSVERFFSLNLLSPKPFLTYKSFSLIMLTCYQSNNTY